jgi:hypothetical protein
MKDEKRSLLNDFYPYPDRRIRQKGRWTEYTENKEAGED